MKKIALSIIIVSVILAAWYFSSRTVTGEAEVPEAQILDPNGEFLLWVTNQGNEIEDVNIRIKIDGKLVCDELFPYEDAHTYKDYRLKLLKGKHSISAVSNNGGAELKQDFELGNEDYGVVTYWFKKNESGSRIEIQELRFMIAEGKVGRY